MIKKIVTLICATFLFSVSTLAMSSSRNKTDRAGVESKPYNSTAADTDSANRQPTYNTNTDTNAAATTNPAYDSSVRSTPPTSSNDTSAGMDSGTTTGSTTGSSTDKRSALDKGSKRAYLDKNCDMNDKECLESQKAKEDSLTH